MVADEKGRGNTLGFLVGIGENGNDDTRQEVKRSEVLEREREL